MTNFSMTLDGGKELQAALDRLEKKTGNKIVRTALRDSQKIMLMSAKASANSVVGGNMGNRIAKALQVRVGKRKIRGSYLFNVSLKNDPEFFSGAKTDRKGVRTKKKIYYIPAAIEYGHTAPNGTFVQPRSFLRSPDDATRQQRIEHFQNKVKQGIEQFWKAK